MWHKVIRKGTEFLKDHWGFIPFTPILYLFIWGATLRIIIDQDKPIRFQSIGPLIYESWCAVNLFAPILMVIVWFLIAAGGREKVLGLWLRLGCDSALFSAMLAYHAADGRFASVAARTSESHLFARYLTGAILMFMLTLIVRDWWAIGVNIYKANRISRVRQH